MNLKQLKQEIDKLVKEGYGSLPVSEINGETGYPEEIRSVRFHYPASAKCSYDRSLPPNNIILDTY